MAERRNSDESTNTRAGVKKMSADDLGLPPPGPPVLVSETGIGIERKRREAREAWENARASRGGWGSNSAATDRYPPPGPTNWVTDGYPHRETDPRNWRTSGGGTHESGSPSLRSRLKEIFDRWLR